MVSSSAAAGQTAEVDSAAHSTGRPEASGNGAARETKVLTFQEAIARLQSYWASVGCAVWQPFNSEVLLSHAFDDHLRYHCASSLLTHVVSSVSALHRCARDSNRALPECQPSSDTVCL